ncbi:hypothetical protein L1D29_06160 [Shewanella insulae]|uniref:hypothetical protein n=1 Tax=Shewanella insulae TaxID=2681496 RepID=UPI001EFDF726|nr:hypothetical protein [Shewanella insulae]MCG9712394.1 hypothetical protein [Shewanella insulae]
MGKKYLILLFLLASKFSLAEDVETICVDYCGPVCENKVVYTISDRSEADKFGVEVYSTEHESQCNGVGISFPNTLGEYGVIFGEFHIGSEKNIKFKSYLEIDEGGAESVNGFCISQELLRESSVTINYGDDYWAWNPGL